MKKSELRNIIQEELLKEREEKIKLNPKTALRAKLLITGKNISMSELVNMALDEFLKGKIL